MSFDKKTAFFTAHTRFLPKTDPWDLEKIGQSKTLGCLWLIINDSSLKTIKSKRKKQLDLADYAKQIPGVDASQINAAPIENV